MKHYIDIQNIREESTQFTEPNTYAFQKGDIISITEKIDGSNASFTKENDRLKAFSRKQELSFKNTLSGFWDWIQTLSPAAYDEKYIYFGEWLRKAKIIYYPEYINRFYLFDIWNKEEERWMEQEFVKTEAEKHGLNYIHEFYYGPFLSWEHCRSFCNSPNYGETQEGIVIKNISKMADENNRYPVYLKIVNKSFKETKHVRTLDPEKEKEKANSMALIESIVTERRIEKAIFRLQDEGILPSVISPQDMKLVAKYLPKTVYDDCVKEEPEILQAAGPYGGKAVSSLTMKTARKLILGN